MSTTHLSIFVLPSVTLCIITLVWAEGIIKLYAFMCMSIGPVTYGFLYFKRKKKNDAEHTARYQELQSFMDENLTSEK